MGCRLAWSCSGGCFTTRISSRTAFRTSARHGTGGRRIRRRRCCTPARFEVRADGASHVPPVGSDARALAIVEYDPTMRRMSYNVAVSRIDPADVLFAHLHRGDRAHTGPVIEILGAARAANLTGSVA